MTTNKTIEDSMSMFFDDEFNPTTYIDHLVSTITQQKTSATPMSAYSKKSLSSLSHTINQLIIHFDYYVNDIANNELKSKLNQLENASSIINSNQEGTSRLQYYTSLLNNSIISLQNELTSINEKLEINEDNEAVQTLIKLKLIKTNLLKVIKILETITLNDDKRLYTIDEFEILLDETFEQIKRNKNDPSVQNYIKNMIEMSNLFQNLNHFNPVFKKFINKLINEQ
ncbi:COG7 [Candida pseudojiufengensis]|uniref:COG7 n=1 Tax=Candida pseudojiufengensis TaxID=497109 RepID=UPI002224CECD|nr:COG7 [Candida pseudojiufengensis]KAI5959055.1 COG7 [Candida pseudojiufengensis]